MKVLVISPKNRTVYNFRGDLIKEMINLGYEVIVTGPTLDDVGKIEELGAKFQLVKLEKTGTNLFNDISYYRSLKRVIKSEKPTVVFSYTIKPVIYGTMSAKSNNVENINALITGTGYLFTSKSFKARFLKFFAKKLYKFSLKKANTVIFQNKEDLNVFVEEKLVQPNKAKLINGSGVNMDIFYPVEFPNTITFFMLARMIKSKGIIEYLNAARIIKEKYDNVRFMMLGNFEEIPDAVTYENVEPFIKDRIVDLYDETDDVRTYYKQSSVYVLPSYREGVPRTVLEAMAMGRPIITTDVPGCRETVIDNKTGFLVKHQNVESLVVAMEKFIKNPNKIIEMGKESYNYCKEKFDVIKINNKMLEYLNINK